MNLYQAMLAQDGRKPDVTDRPVKDIRKLKADHHKPRNAKKKASFLRVFRNR
jgi:hypothetical protein